RLPAHGITWKTDGAERRGLTESLILPRLDQEVISEIVLFSVLENLRVGTSGWLTMNQSSVHQMGRLSPWRGRVCFSSGEPIEIRGAPTVFSPSGLLCQQSGLT